MNQVTVYKIEVRHAAAQRYSFVGHFAELPTPGELAEIILAEADKIRSLSDGDELDTERCSMDADDLDVVAEVVRAVKHPFSHSCNTYRVTLARVEVGTIIVTHIMVYDKNAVPLISIHN